MKTVFLPFSRKIFQTSAIHSSRYYRRNIQGRERVYISLESERDRRWKEGEIVLGEIDAWSLERGGSLRMRRVNPLIWQLDSCFSTNVPFSFDPFPGRKDLSRGFSTTLSLFLSLSVCLGGKTAAWREGGGEGVRKRKEDKPCRVTQNLRLVLTKRARIMCSNGDTLSRGLEEAPGANACRNYTRWFECFCPPRSIVTLQEFGRWKNYSTLFPTSLK